MEATLTQRKRNNESCVVIVLNFGFWIPIFCTRMHVGKKKIQFLHTLRLFRSVSKATDKYHILILQALQN